MIDALDSRLLVQREVHVVTLLAGTVSRVLQRLHRPRRGRAKTIKDDKCRVTMVMTNRALAWAF